MRRTATVAATCPATPDYGFTVGDLVDYTLGPPRRFSLQHVLILQPDEAPAPDHDVIQHVDTQQPNRFHGLLGQARVLRKPL